MSPRPVIGSIGRHPVLTSLVVLALASLVWLALAAASRPASSSAPTNMGTMSMSTMNMSDEAMRQANAEWFAKHPARGLRTTAAPVDSFIALTTSFNEDNNTLTQIDTARIQVGDAILFKYGSGIGHSVVNGTGSLDPNMGTLFNLPLGNSSQNFTFTFTTAGIVPFFCALHESFNMKGVVIVSEPAGVGPGAAVRAGFLAPPWPNPSRAGVNVRFALARAGRAKLEVLDAQGRQVALVLDRDLPAGETPASWDGRSAHGQNVAPGVYFLRLSAPDLTDTRRVSIEH